MIKTIRGCALMVISPFESQRRGFFPTWPAHARSPVGIAGAGRVGKTSRCTKPRAPMGTLGPSPSSAESPRATRDNPVQRHLAPCDEVADAARGAEGHRSWRRRRRHRNTDGVADGGELRAFGGVGEEAAAANAVEPALRNVLTNRRRNSWPARSMVLCEYATTRYKRLFDGIVER